MIKLNEIISEISSLYKSEDKEVMNPGLIFKAIDALKRPNRFMVEINGDIELERYVALHIAGSHAPKDIELSDAELFTPEAMKGHISQKDLAMIGSLMKMVTTHLPKHNEALVNGDNVFSLKKSECTVWGVCSLNTNADNTSRRLAFSGNAAVAPKKFLYAMDFILNGERTSFINEIAIENGVVVATLHKAGFNESAVSLMIDVARSMLDSGVPELVEGNQVLWPVVNGEYHAISPMPSAQMLADLNESIKTRREDSYLPLIRKSVGGTKPLNASDLNSLIGSGSSQVLSVDLSFINKNKTLIEKLVERRNPLIGRINLALVGLDNQVGLHKKGAAKYRRQITELMLISLARLIEVKGMVKRGEFDTEQLAIKEERLFMSHFESQVDLGLFKKYLIKSVNEAYNAQKIEITDVMHKEISVAASVVIERVL
ncbi:hypothetical protein LMH73_006190 [Vibrio splendidus]|nr:hypothetical protein [Vibrio splendidus]MCC4880743.1 hypothetical protein [Vibrio splendidus]